MNTNNIYIYTFIYTYISSYRLCVKGRHAGAHTHAHAHAYAHTHTHTRPCTEMHPYHDTRASLKTLFGRKTNSGISSV